MNLAKWNHISQATRASFEDTSNWNMSWHFSCRQPKKTSGTPVHLVAAARLPATARRCCRMVEESCVSVMAFCKVLELNQGILGHVRTCRVPKPRYSTRAGNWGSLHCTRSWKCQATTLWCGRGHKYMCLFLAGLDSTSRTNLDWDPEIAGPGPAIASCQLPFWGFVGRDEIWPDEWTSQLSHEKKAEPTFHWILES